MALKGEKFELDLSNQALNDEKDAKLAFAMPLVSDIKERDVSTQPAPPVFKSNNTGFPAHRRRFARTGVGKPSASTVATSNQSAPVTTIEKAVKFEDQERGQIDQENKAKIDSMSEEEIQEERRQLLDSLPSSLIERLLKKATVEEDSGGFDNFPREPPPDIRVETVEEDKIKRAEPARESKTTDSRSVHFPQPPSVPSLDPSSPGFLASLKDTYYPTLSHDPNKLSWMQKSPIETSSYSPSLQSVAASALRFDFRGVLLPPRTAASIPVTAGLHHHGDAPDSAGYTIPELAHLSRSTVPAQRCIAYQTLGRFLYRLGKDEWGQEVCEGLEGCVKRGRIIDTLIAAAGDGTDGEKHLSARQYAIEAVWLWRKGLGDEEVKLPSGPKAQSS